MTELVVALLMIVQGEIQEARIQPSMGKCLRKEKEKLVEQKLLVEMLDINV